MEPADIYRAKLVSADDAAAMIPSGSRLSMGMAMAEPPALLQALAQRAEAGNIEDLRVYYVEATSIAGKTILRYDLNDRIRPYCMFITAAERALIKQGVADGRKVVNYVPNNFHQAPRLLICDIGIDSFVCTVSPMDRHGYMSFGVGNDYSTKVARAARKLIVEINENMPRVYGAGAALHMSEVTAITENHVPLLELPVRQASPEDEAISRTIAGLVPDGACRAVAERWVCVIVIPGNVALRPAVDGPPALPGNLLLRPPTVTPAAEAVATLAELLNSGERVTILCGAGCEGAHDELMQVAEALQAPIVHALRGKEHVEGDNPTTW